MPGSLSHSPAKVTRDLLIQAGLGSDGGTSWPVFATSEPDAPDNAITVYNAAGRGQGTTAPDGEVQESHGVQVRVRCATEETGYAKARAIAVALDAVANALITIAGTQYMVQLIDRSGDVLSLGKDPSSSRRLFTLNALVTLTMLPTR